MLEKNTKKVNALIAKIFAVCSVAIFIMVICSCLGIFEFGKKYTEIVFILGLLISVSPSILIWYFPDNVMKYYMLIAASVFIGVLGTNNHIGIYISYILVPIFSCLYFEPPLVLKSSLFSYIVMIVAVYINSASKFEVVYMKMDRTGIFIAYVLGFTIEYIIVTSILYFLVKRARKMMEESYIAKESNYMKSKFLSSMSHEIRTPMNAIIGMADVALRKDMSDDLRKYITIIKSSSTGLLEIVNDILDLSKIEAGKLNIITDQYKTQALVEEMESIINARNIDEKVPIFYHIGDNLPPVLEGDVVRIRQVMLNFASNAIKYTDSGQIDITLSCEKIDEEYVNLKFIVKDTGQGIRQDEISKLFTMYSQLNTTKNHGKEGTGIGLAISKYFIDNMNGTVEVESDFGKGSTFSFTVPQKIVSQIDKFEYVERANSDENTSCMFKTKDVDILIVDDNEINREVLKEIIAPFEFNIDEAENGLEAVNMVKLKKYDLVFMDSHMPVMNGEEATIQIRKLNGYMNSNVPIIAITADAISGVKEQLLEVGMNEYIIKPIDIKVLSDIIRKYIPEAKIVKG